MKNLLLPLCLCAFALFSGCKKKNTPSPISDEKILEFDLNDIKILPDGDSLKNFANSEPVITTAEQEKFTQNPPSGVKVEKVNDSTYNLIIPKGVLKETIGQELKGNEYYQDHWKKSPPKALRLKITTRGHFSFYTLGNGVYLAVQNIAQQASAPVSDHTFTNTKSQSFYLYLSSTKYAEIISFPTQEVFIFLLDKSLTDEKWMRCEREMSNEEEAKACEEWGDEQEKIMEAAPKVVLNIIVSS